MKERGEDHNVFELRLPFRDPVRQKLFGMMRKSIERLFLLEQLNRLYQAAAAPTGGDFLQNTMNALGVDLEVSGEDLARVPATGPVVVVANHPFGGIEGVVLLRLLRRVRDDAKIMANYLLGRMPEMHPYCIFVDPFGGTRAPRSNLKPMKESLRWVRDGHLLTVFPAGEVSHFDPRRRHVTDPRWSETIAGIIRRTGATVVPVFVEGRNSLFFQLMGMVHPRLRTVMLPRELLNKRGQTLRFRVGTPVAPARLARFERDDALMDYLRLRTYILMSRDNGGPAPVRPRGARTAHRPPPVPVAEPLYPELLAQDVALLSPESCLLETEDFAVYAVTAPQIPRLLHEIGRLREITFRQEGEGTGRAVDLDRFDQYYTHLILWNRPKSELVGAYRIGKTDEILSRYGKKGLYTSELFRYRTKLLKTMGPALELGRSFIRPEYQRQYTSLLLLWKGIARFITRERRYTSLFGPVSINNEYNTVSRQMLEAFLRANNFATDSARYVRPRNPPARRRAKHEWNPEVLKRVIASPDEMSDLIAEIERDQKGVPILLKQYLKLGGKLLGFNVDPDFSDVLDGLIWVNLLETDPRILARFFGKTDAEAYLAEHRARHASPAPCRGLRRRRRAGPSS